MERRTSPWRPIAVATGFALLALGAGACSSPEGPSGQPTAPTISCPADIAAVSNDGNPVSVSYVTPTAAGGTAPVTVTCSPPSGSTFQPGTTSVVCVAKDAAARTGTCGFSVKVSVPRLSAARFMAFGDSITEGKPGPKPFGDFPGSYPSRLQDMLAARYPLQSMVVTRQGNGGETTAGGLDRLPSALVSDHPQVVLLVEGVNDLYGGNRAAIAPAMSNLRQMIQLSRMAGASVYLGTLTPERQGALRASAYPVLPEFNRGVTALAAEMGCPLVDLFAALSPDGPAYNTYVDWDGLHLTQAGYQKVAEVFFDRIRGTLETTNLPVVGSAERGTSGVAPGVTASASGPLRQSLR